MSATRSARIVLVCLTLGLCLGGNLAANSVQTNVLTNQADRIVLEFRIGSLDSSLVLIDGESYESLSLPGEAIDLNQGAPALPYAARSVVIPDNAKMTIQVLSADYEERFARIAPSKGNLLRTVDPNDVPFEFGPAYQNNAFYPGPLVKLGDPYIMRDRRGTAVRIRPFQFNPVTGVLRVYSRIKVEITPIGPGEINVFDRARLGTRSSRVFQDLYHWHFVNEEASTPRYDPMVEDGGMLIICHDAWLGNMASFVTHKNNAGIPTTIVGVSTIGNNYTAIKDHIQSVYDTSDLAYVLLVGDIDEIASPIVSGGASDPTYSKLAGDDDYPEIIVGRFSAQSPAEVDTQVQRTIDYETMQATQQDWFWKGIGIGSAEGAGIGDEGQSDIAHLNEIRDWLMSVGYTEVDQVYDPGATDTEVAVAVNAGRGVINYTGHGSPTAWSSSGFNNSDVNALTNVDKLPFIISVACNNGEFENYNTCFGEAWLRATSGGSPSGAIGVYASTISQSWAPPMEGQDEFNILLTDATEPYHSYGALCYAGSSSMMDAYGAGGVSMFNTWIIFGDPSLRVIGTIGPPTGLRVYPNAGLVVEGPAGGPFAPVTVQYTLDNLDEEPLAYDISAGASWVSVDSPRGTIPPLDQIVVTLTVDVAARNFDNGHYLVDVSFVNEGETGGDTIRGVALNVGSPILRGQWNFDVSPGWAIEYKWAYGIPTGGGGTQLGYPDPTSGATGDNVYGFNLRGDYQVGMGGPYYATTSAVDLSDSEGSSLRFQRWLNVEATPDAEATVEVSSDGSNWTEIWTNSGSVTDSAWAEQHYDISAIADHQSTVYVRWGLGAYADATPCSGWNIDDIELWGVSEASAKTTLTVERDGLAWTAVEGAESYDIVTGGLDALLASAGDFSVSVDGCVTDDWAGTSFDYAGGTLDPGEGEWYLIRGVSPAGPMTYQALAPSQVGVRDDEINSSGATCP